MWVYSGFVFCVFFYVSLDHFVLVLLAFVVLGLVSSVFSQEIGWEERLRNDIFCVKWDVHFNIRSDIITFVSQVQLEHIDKIRTGTIH